MNTTDDPLRSLEARYYTDEAIFRAEQDGLLARTWQFAGHASSLEKTGDYFTFEIAGENLFCIRDKHAEIRCFYNVCQHRAHQLLQGSGNNALIVCPYHAWNYHLDGRLRSGPNIKVVPGFDKTKICLTKVAVENLHGFIFVNLDRQAKPMESWFPGVREQLEKYVPDIAALKPVKWNEVPERCNWKVSVENYSECYHCKLNHRTFATGVVKPETYDIQPQGYCLRHTTECQNLDKMTYPIDLDANQHAGDYSSWYLWPLFSFQVYPGNVLNTYHWRPAGADKVILWRGWYTVEGTPSDVIEALAQQDLDTTVAEDITLVESVQKGLHSRGYVPGPLVLDPNSGVDSEHSIATLQQWMRNTGGDTINP